MPLDPKAGINTTKAPQWLTDLVGVVDPVTQVDFAMYVAQYIAAQRVSVANALAAAALAGQPLDPAQVALWNTLCAAQSAGH